MPPRKNRNPLKKDAADAEKSKSKSKPKPSPSSPLPTTSTAATSCILPRKIVMSILSRLPVKSLVRFKGVCKQWNSLVTNQEFIKIHYNRFSDAPKTCSANSQLLECSKLGLNPRKKTADHPDQSKQDCFFLATCRGLICLARPLATDRVILWNPATRLWKVLPRTSYQGTAEISSLGFGCNAERDDVKVVRIHCMKGKKMKVYAEVYSSKLDSWKAVDVGFDFRTLSVSQAAAVNGNPHWVVVNEFRERGLLRFDATAMLFERMRFPLAKEEEDLLAVVDLNGRLGVLHCVRRRNDWLEIINVWEYVDIDKEWEIKSSFEGGGLRRLQARRCEDYSWRKGKIVGRRVNGGLFEYDVKNGGVIVFGVQRSATGFLQMNVFEESLAYVRGMAAMDLATAVADGDHEIEACISEGFITWVVPHDDAGRVQIFYQLAY